MPTPELENDECSGCVYGPEYVDDGVPHRLIVEMCQECKDANELALDWLTQHRSER